MIQLSQLQNSDLKLWGFRGDQGSLEKEMFRGRVRRKGLVPLPFILAYGQKVSFSYDAAGLKVKLREGLENGDEKYIYNRLPEQWFGKELVFEQEIARVRKLCKRPHLGTSLSAGMGGSLDNRMLHTSQSQRYQQFFEGSPYRIRVFRSTEGDFWNHSGMIYHKALPDSAPKLIACLVVHEELVEPLRKMLYVGKLDDSIKAALLVESSFDAPRSSMPNFRAAFRKYVYRARGIEPILVDGLEGEIFERVPELKFKSISELNEWKKESHLKVLQQLENQSL